MKPDTSRVLRTFLVPSLLAMAVIITGYYPRSENRAREGDSLRLLEARNEEVIRITIEGPLPGIPLVIERESDYWSMRFGDEMRYPADKSTVDGFLDELAKRRRAFNVDGIDGYAYGSSGPGSCNVRIDAGKGSVNLAFGQSNADERYRYLRIDGGPVCRTDNALASWLDNRTSRWVDLFPFRKRLAGNSVQRVIAYGDGGYRETNEAGALRDFEYGIASLKCRDISNIPPSPELYLRVECGDASAIQLSFTRLDAETVLMTEMDMGRSWVMGSVIYESLIRPLITGA